VTLSKILALVGLFCAVVSLLGIPAAVYVLPVGLACVAGAVLVS